MLNNLLLQQNYIRLLLYMNYMLQNFQRHLFYLHHRLFLLLHYTNIRLHKFYNYYLNLNIDLHYNYYLLHTLYDLN